MAVREAVGIDVKDAPIGELRAMAELQEFRHAQWQTTDGAAGMELFRRAIVERDDAAWRAVVEIYRGMLAAQAGRRAVRGLVAEDDGFCVDRAFQRFWVATTRNRLKERQFEDLASILKYLKMCLASVLLDEARARRRAAWVSLDDLDDFGNEACVSGDPCDYVVNRMARREAWTVIDGALTQPNERLVARLSFVAGLSPREILARHPERFTDVFDVYRTKRNMIDRLRRSAAIQELRPHRNIHARLHGPGDAAYASASLA